MVDRIDHASHIWMNILLRRGDFAVPHDLLDSEWINIFRGQCGCGGVSARIRSEPPDTRKLETFIVPRIESVLVDAANLPNARVAFLA